MSKTNESQEQDNVNRKKKVQKKGRSIYDRWNHSGLAPD